MWITGYLAYPMELNWSFSDFEHIYPNLFSPCICSKPTSPHHLSIVLPRLAVSQMEECLKKGAEARKYAISLGTLEYSGDLVKELLKFNTKMEEVYKKMQQLRQEKTANPKFYQKFFAIIEEKAAWFDKAEARMGKGWAWYSYYISNGFTICRLRHLD